MNDINYLPNDSRCSSIITSVKGWSYARGTEVVNALSVTRVKTPIPHHKKTEAQAFTIHAVQKEIYEQGLLYVYVQMTKACT